MSSRSKATNRTTTDHDARRDAGGDRSEELAALREEGPADAIVTSLGEAAALGEAMAARATA